MTDRLAVYLVILLVSAALALGFVWPDSGMFLLRKFYDAIEYLVFWR